MDTSLISVAFLLGFIGSLHCIGMCGGLVAALGIGRSGVPWLGLILYQSGRIFSYAMLGLITGLLGASLRSVETFAGIQWGLSVLAGVVMLVFALNLGGWMPDPLLKLGGRALSRLGLAGHLKAAASSPWPWRWFIAGMANGLLPCGLVYAALSLALSSGSLLGSASMMVVFGLATVPAMMVAPVVIGSISPAQRALLLKLLAIALILLALFTIYRGNPWLASDHAHTTHMQHGMQHP